MTAFQADNFVSTLRLYHAWRLLSSVNIIKRDIFLSIMSLLRIYMTGMMMYNIDIMN